MGLIDNFKNQRTIYKILDIATVISFIYFIFVDMSSLLPIWPIGIRAIMELVEWFFKKEE